MASASGSQDGNVSGLELSRFSDSVPVRRSRFEFDIFDTERPLWRDTKTIEKDAIPLGNICNMKAIFKISPDNSKVLVYDPDLRSLVLFGSPSFSEISRLDLGSGDVESQMSFSSDGTLVAVHVKNTGQIPDANKLVDSDKHQDAGQHPNVDQTKSGLLVLSVPSLAVVKRVPDNYMYHDKCSFIKGDNSRILILHPGDTSTTLYMYNLSTMSKVWEIDRLSDNMFALTEDCSKVFLSVILEKTSRGDRKEFILVDTTTGERISSTVYPRPGDYIDCAAFSEDGRKLVISIGNCTAIQVISLPEFTVLAKPFKYYQLGKGNDKHESDDDESDDECEPVYESDEIEGRFYLEHYKTTVFRVIVSPNANLAMLITAYNAVVFDIENKRPKMSSVPIGNSSYYNGLEVSSDKSMMVFGPKGIVSLMHARSRGERRLTAILEAMLELMLASRRRRIRLPSEIWRMILEEFL